MADASQLLHVSYKPQTGLRTIFIGIHHFIGQTAEQ
jgi:hypothetical protein